MNLLDENFPEDQTPLLRAWRIPFRKVGREVAFLGIKDRDIIPVLHQLPRVTFFTQDKGFYARTLCHPTYCLVWLDVSPDDAAFYLRRFLRHPTFKTHAERLGKAIRLHHAGIEVWTRGAPRPTKTGWPV